MCLTCEMFWGDDEEDIDDLGMAVFFMLLEFGDAEEYPEEES